MREDCVNKLADAWYQILAELSGQYPLLGQLALKNIRYYVGWIDIQLIVNEKFVTLFGKLLENNHLREKVCLCLEQIVSKGMNFKAKYEMITYLRILPLIISIKDTNDEDFLLTLGKLLNATGMQAIQCRTEAYQSKAEPQITGKFILFIHSFIIIIHFAFLFFLFLNKKYISSSLLMQYIFYIIFIYNFLFFGFLFIIFF